MMANALAAALAAFFAGIDENTIRRALADFMPGPEHTPGRLNLFQFNDVDVLVDYAHNPHGYEAVAEYIKSMPHPCKTGIISGLGDRRDEDIKKCAEIAAKAFDKIIIRQEEDLRGRSEEAINSLLLEGIASSGKELPCELISDEISAVKKALADAVKGELIVALSDQYEKVNACLVEVMGLENGQEELSGVKM
jgi:cyanophycin synthetase